ncbi:MAG TPA: MFS transporter [Thermomicrobiales bacterium]|nr:MFS transporter [Thermomicrobiales bacterium]
MSRSDAAQRSDSIRAVLGNGAFLRLWVVQAVTQVAQNMINFALLLRVRTVVETHDVAQANTAISLVILSFSLPAVLFGPVAGVVADRVNKRALMAVLNLARAVAVLLFLLIRPEWHPETILLAYYIVTFIFGIAGQFFAPVLGATIPIVAPRHQLVSANALFNLTFTAAQLVGFAAAGPILSKLLGIDLLFGVTVAVYLVCAALVLTIPPTPTRAVAVPGTSFGKLLVTDIKEGLVYILQDPTLMRAIGYLTLAQTTFLMIAALGPEFISGVIGLDQEDIGYIVAPAGLGVLLGVLLVPRILRRFGRGWLIDIALTAAGFMLAGLAAVRYVMDWMWTGGASPVWIVTVVAALLAATLGLCNAFILVPSQTMLQERSHEGVRARVYATFFTISNTASFIPIFFAAAFADLFGVVQVLAVLAIIIVGLGGSALLHRRQAERSSWERVRTMHSQGPDVLRP